VAATSGIWSSSTVIEVLSSAAARTNEPGKSAFAKPFGGPTWVVASRVARHAMLAAGMLLDPRCSGLSEPDVWARLCVADDDARRTVGSGEAEAQAENGSESWPGGGAQGLGAGASPRSWRARTRAMSSGSVATSSHRIAPEHLGQTVTSSRNTWRKSHAYGLRTRRMSSLSS